jgi:hypothetical protein
MGGNSGGGGTIPFNMNALKAVMPSVFQGPYNAQGALQNEKMIASKFPWATPPAGQFEGAQPGQFAGAGPGGPPNPSPPIPSTVPPGAQASTSAQPGAQANPMTGAAGATNGMMPAPLQQILSVLMAGAPSGGQ